MPHTVLDNQSVILPAEPPWAWYRYMKLIETIDAIQASTACTTTEGSPGLVKRRENALRVVGSDHQPETAQPRPEKIPVRLPM